MLKKPGDRYPATGIGYVLSPNDDLLVRDGITIHSFDDFGVLVNGRGAKVGVNGTIISEDDDAIRITADDVRVTIGATGLLYAGGEGIEISGDRNTIVNAGQITGSFGILLVDDGDLETGITRLTNHGSIVTFGLTVNFHFLPVTSRAVVTNTGLIRSFNSDAIVFGDGSDLLVNSGVVFGRVDLAGGNDVYDGRGGTVFGGIFGYTGNDRFIAGRAAERFKGEEGTDTVDYRYSKGVHAALDENFPGTGSATGDTFKDIENLYGSLTGADSLRGDIGGNLLRGYGGDDTLFGFDGDDSLNGGAGADTIIAGVGFDRIVFDKASHGGDQIADFDGLTDAIFISRAGFKLNLPLGQIDPSRFQLNTTKQAGDAGDRFIFRTTDDTLWFDRDGTRGKFAPVLIADSSGTDISDVDIFLF